MNNIHLNSTNDTLVPFYSQGSSKEISSSSLPLPPPAPNFKHFFSVYSTLTPFDPGALTLTSVLRLVNDFFSNLMNTKPLQEKEFFNTTLPYLSKNEKLYSLKPINAGAHHAASWSQQLFRVSYFGEGAASAATGLTTNSSSTLLDPQYQTLIDKDSWGINWALAQAVENDDEGSILILLSHKKADQITQWGINGALLKASKKGHISIARILLEHSGKIKVNSEGLDKAIKETFGVIKDLLISYKKENL